MKKQLLLFTILFISAGLMAQPVLNSNEMLPPGSSMHFKYIQNLNSIDTSLQGPNQTWNFSGLIQDMTIPELNVQIATPAQTPYGALFPTANYAYIESPTTAYRYFNLSNTKMERVGSYYSGPNTFNDPQTEYIFPLQLGVTNMDTWDNTNSSFGGNYDLVCLGYGTLILPNATYNDVLMVRVDFNEGGIIAIQSYFWYDSNSGAILMDFIKGDGTFILDNGFYISALNVGIQENEIALNLRYNNPVLQSLKVNITPNISGDFNYTLINSMGQLSGSGAFNGKALQQNTLEVPMEKLPAGIYFLELRSGSAHETLRVMKL